jgi:hypothetical protein
MSRPPVRGRSALEGKAALLADDAQITRDVRTRAAQLPEATRMERVRFINHKGKHILVVDLTDCAPDEVTKVVSEVQRVVTKQSPQSVLILTDFRGARFSRAAFTRIKEVAVFDRPFVKRAAFVGAESLPNAFYEGLKTFSRREFPRFKTREEAMDWLVRENAAQSGTEPGEWR